MDVGKKTERIEILLTAGGFVTEENHPEEESSELRKWRKRFEKDRITALYDLIFLPKPTWLDKTGLYLYEVGEQFLRNLTRRTDLELLREKVSCRYEEEDLQRLLDKVPFVPGSEYVNEEWLSSLAGRLNEKYCEEVRTFKGSVALYLAGKSQKLKVPERIFFHLVERIREGEEDYPFGFLATYSTKIRGGVEHKPLQYALTEYQNGRGKLLELLSCLNRAADVSPLIGGFVKSGEMFHPLRITAKEAYEFLRDVEKIESIGIICRIPNWWRKKNAGVSLGVTIGEKKPSLFGLESLIEMQPSLSVGGISLSEAEIRELLASTEGLAYLKGRWVEVDHARLHELLETMKKYKGKLTLKEALRMGLDERSEEDPDGGVVISNGQWLSELLRSMRSPERVKSVAVPKTFKATLRPYQKNGYGWLRLMSSLGFGACLADDMGLGKTVQVLAYLERFRKDQKDARVLLIVPASLMGNWQKEAEKFAPSMPVAIMHGGGEEGRLAVLESKTFLTVTTYGMAARTEAISKVLWDCVILDEAQAIKNPATKQTRQIKKLQSKMRIALTGTPIENDLTNLWSLFDFLNKGLLGGSDEFGRFCKSLEARPEGYSKLKAMIAPFMLRRVKTDKSIISDLPDKLEQIDYVDLSKKQTVLYRKYVADVAKKLEMADTPGMKMSGMERRGLILASLIRLKQLCNHPSQYLGQPGYEEKDSGKFAMLRDICETIYEKRERVLVFTQFKEIIPYLDDYLADIFHKRGLVLHGSTSVKSRSRLVEQFQGESYVPYMILSVKAGGTGLTLTNASHVIHFDRWWNPAVENQATDRAFRIGQKNNVVVHKLVCRGTIEEKINTLIESKKELAENVIGSSGENWITEMSNDELLNVLKLD
ncbi:MAG: DEAD/DEAH box helicase [Lachnospiraceae bacterium]|nr:DEAD/DEAH box helicase [Lachnospiraceae bacterium]